MIKEIMVYVVGITIIVMFWLPYYVLVTAFLVLVKLLTLKEKDDGC